MKNKIKIISIILLSYLPIHASNHSGITSEYVEQQKDFLENYMNNKTVLAGIANPVYDWVQNSGQEIIDDLLKTDIDPQDLTFQNILSSDQKLHPKQPFFGKQIKLPKKLNQFEQDYILATIRYHMAKQLFENHLQDPNSPYVRIYAGNPDEDSTIPATAIQADIAELENQRQQIIKEHADMMHKIELAEQTAQKGLDSLKATFTGQPSGKMPIDRSEQIRNAVREKYGASQEFVAVQEAKKVQQRLKDERETLERDFITMMRSLQQEEHDLRAQLQTAQISDEETSESEDENIFAVVELVGFIAQLEGRERTHKIFDILEIMQEVKLHVGHR